MSHSPTNHNTISSQRFLCPVPTCQRACKTKSGWTRHLRSVHPHLDFSGFQSQNPIINLSHFVSLIPTHGNRRGLASSPIGGLDYADTGRDVEMEDMTLNSDGATRNDFAHSDPRSSPSRDSELGNDNEHHPIVNGKFISDTNHATSNRQSAGKPCDRDGNPLSGSEPPTSNSRDTLADDWAPFEDRSAFELAEFLYKRDQMSAGNIDEALRIISDIVAPHGGQPPFLDHDDMYHLIDTIPIGGVPWESFTFTYDGPKPAIDVPKWMDAEYTIWFRDPHQLFLNMLKNPDFVDSCDYGPYRQYDKQGNRQYEHFMTGDWAWKQAVRTRWSLSVYYSQSNSYV
jgi:hypothetical protein